MQKKRYWAFLLLVCGIWTLATAKFPDSLKVELDGQVGLGLARAQVRAKLKEQGLTLWKTAKHFDSFDASEGDSIKSLSVTYGVLEQAESIAGSARPLSIQGAGSLSPGDSEEKIVKVLGHPDETVARDPQKLLIYGGKRFVLWVGPQGFHWFSLSSAPTKLSEI